VRKLSKDAGIAGPYNSHTVNKNYTEPGGRMSTVKTYVFLFLFAFVALVPARAQQGDDAFQQGNHFFALGQYEMALTQYRIAASSLSEQRPLAQFNIGVCHHRLGRLTDAVTAYRVAIKSKGGRYAKASYALGLALNDLRDWTSAKDAFAQAVTDSNGRDAEALFQLALSLARESDHAAAAKTLQRAIQHAGKTFPGGHNNLGVILALHGRWDDALREFELAIKQSNGKMTEAVDNLKLCRTLIHSSNRTLLASLRTTKQAQ
jgi:tetratricopeptide (TPR) repeat protein